MRTAKSNGGITLLEEMENNKLYKEDKDAKIIPKRVLKDTLI